VSNTVQAALTRATETDALVVLASPVTAFPRLLRAIDETAPTVRLTDVAGVKAPVDDDVATLALAHAVPSAAIRWRAPPPPAGRRAPPICSTARSG